MVLEFFFRTHIVENNIIRLYPVCLFLQKRFLEMQNYLFPKYVSATEWAKHGLVPPVDRATYLTVPFDTVCPCVFRSGHFFCWKEARRLLPDRSLLATNDPVIENAMWHLHSLLQLVEMIRTGRGQSASGKLIQDSLRVLDVINAMDWPRRKEDMALLILNRDKPWNKLQPGQIKLPWLLLPACNESVRLWLESELVLCRQTWALAHPPFKVRETVEFYVQSYRLLNRAVECATICPADYKTALERERKLRTVDAFFWLGHVAADEVHKLKLFEGARDVAFELGKDFSPDKFQKIETATDKAKKTFTALCGILNYSATPNALEQLNMEPVSTTLELSNLMQFEFV